MWLSSLNTSPKARQFYSCTFKPLSLVFSWLECVIFLVFGLTRSKVFSWTTLFSTQMSRGLLGRILSRSRPLWEEPLPEWWDVCGPGHAGKSHVPVCPGLRGRGLPALNHSPLLCISLLSEWRHLPRAQPE